MAEIGYSIAANLIEMLANQSINEICRLWKYETHLQKLQQTVSTIQQVFLDADGKWDQLSNQDRDFIKKLKDVVYDAEDVFDEFRTWAELNQLGKKSKVRKFFGKVRDIFSPDMNKNKVYYSYRVSRDVMDIKERLDTIAIEHKLFELKFDHKPIVRRPKETCSYIDGGKIIGRDNDKELIIDMLLDPNVKAVTIVGMGGLGKTALAQLVFNDDKIKSVFSEDRFWVCVSDQEGEQFDVKTILCKILESVAPYEKVEGTSSLERVKNQFQEKTKEKKNFLVLDDVWNEDRVKWAELEEFLCMGQGGSKIVVTTRSEQTARIIKNKRIYKLEGLSQEDSQCLFEMSAFGEGEKNKEFVEIGKKIVGKCHRNPLAIKVLGSLLFGEEDLSKWECIKNSELIEINDDKVNIMPILKLSFHKLTPFLKSCFSYCAIFPKDTIVDKGVLISLWMSQRYIVPLYGGQTIEDAAEEYFLILMRRCFFQDIRKDVYDNVISVKIHDLMHDVAKKVAEEQICVVTSKESNLGEKIRHVNIVGGRCANSLFLGSTIRSYISSDTEESLTDKQVENLITLRVLHLSYIKINKSLFYSIDRLLLLRYLYLKDKYLKEIPNSITRLYNLETLILECEGLRELPIDFCKLVKLRHLDVRRTGLNGMPMGMDKLTRLTVLPYFVAGGNSVNELQVLQVLTEIKGRLHVKVSNNYNYVSGFNNYNGGEYLKSMRHLTHLSIEFELEDECGDQGLMKNLEPPLNLKGLELNSYKGTTIPWSLFPHQHHFVCISIEKCPNLKQIPVLSTMPHLKQLKLRYLDHVEYIEEEISSITCSNDSEAVLELFPSLESFEISGVEKLKGWWKGKLPGRKLTFPRLSFLDIMFCPNLTSFASCSNPQHIPEHEFPRLHTLKLWCCNRLASNLICPILKRLELKNKNENLLVTCAISQDGTVKLEDVNIDKVGYLNSIPTDCLSRLWVDTDREVESMLEVGEALQRCASTLRSLNIGLCKNLSRLSGLEQLTVLEELNVWCNDNLSIREEDEEPWKSFHQTLRTLEFSGLPQMKSLPKGMRHLTSLQTFKLFDYENAEGSLPEWISSLSSLQLLHLYRCTIKSLPEAIKNLTSLKKLMIVDCPGLEERCQRPNGEDFPKIQNIPDIYTW